MTRFVSTIAVATAILLVTGCGSTSSTVAPSNQPITAAPTVGSTGAPSAEASFAPSSARPSPLPPASPGAAGSPPIDPANFTATIDNEWLPLVPGTTFTYRGTKDGKHAVDKYTVLDKTTTIGGVTCRLISDRLYLDGALEEKTTDYYTQDLQGNVWYFGEDTEELDAKGAVTSREGSWHAGVDGALPGIFMPATPAVGDAFRQEFYKSHAEDQFAVLDLAATVKVPLGSFRNVLLTKEWTALEPSVLDNKYYVRGIGEVREVAVKGPTEELVLVSVSKH